MARKIENASLEMGSSEVQTYGDLLALIVRQPKEGGMQVDEMRKALKVADAAEKAGEWIVLENEQYDYARQKVAAFPFGVASTEVIAFADAVEGAEEVDLNATAAPAGKRKGANK